MKMVSFGIGTPFPSSRRTCPKTGIPCLKYLFTFTNVTLVMILVTSIIPVPVNSSPEKEIKRKTNGDEPLAFKLFLYFLCCNLTKNKASIFMVLSPIFYVTHKPVPSSLILAFT